LQLSGFILYACYCWTSRLYKTDVSITALPAAPPRWGQPPWRDARWRAHAVALLAFWFNQTLRQNSARASAQRSACAHNDAAAGKPAGLTRRNAGGWRAWRLALHLPGTLLPPPHAHNGARSGHWDRMGPFPIPLTEGGGGGGGACWQPAESPSQQATISPSASRRKAGHSLKQDRHYLHLNQTGGMPWGSAALASCMHATAPVPHAPFTLLHLSAARTTCAQRRRSRAAGIAYTPRSHTHATYLHLATRAGNRARMLAQA